jgi:ornithine decarboxylase
MDNFQSWMLEMPSVEPFYVVKCNDESSVLAVIAGLGAGFVCYSKAEMLKLFKLGVDSSRILYGNPCRPKSQLEFAMHHGIDLLTFESESELHKLKTQYDKAKLVLKVNPLNDRIQFGCHVDDVSHLLHVASQLDMTIIGLSLHLGDDILDLSEIEGAVDMARSIFSVAKDFGFEFSLLDIGGGDFIGKENSEFTFQELACTLRQSLDQFLLTHSDVRVIIESGNFFLQSAFSIAVRVLEHKEINSEFYGNTGSIIAPDDVEVQGYGGRVVNSYLVSDGVYGSFGNLLTCHDQLEPILMKEVSGDGSWETSCVCGPSCDSLDVLVSNCVLPRLDCGDWLAFRHVPMMSQTDKDIAKKFVIHEKQWLQLCLMTADMKAKANMKLLAGDEEWESISYVWPET